MRDHWLKDFPTLSTDEDYYVECAINDAHGLRHVYHSWKDYLELLSGRLDYFLGRIDE